MAGVSVGQPTSAEEDRLHVLRRFAAVLGGADDEAFLLLIWGVNALQSGNAEGGAAVFPFGFPPSVATEDMSTDWSIYPWELETLANELLALPKAVHRATPCNLWETVPEVVNLLRRIDDLDFTVKMARMNIFRELFRTTGRQFDWQRGYLNVPQFYRNVFIYGQGTCADYFRDRHGISINEFTVVGFGMFANFAQRPNFAADGDFSLLNVTPAMRNKAVNILAAPLSDLRRLASREREQWETIAYRPSVLRRYPCVRYGRRGWKVRAPLPALILERITSGLFYDVIPGGGSIRDDYGRRFEQYALRFLRAMHPGLESEPESAYRIAGNRMLSPDIIVLGDGGAHVQLAIECKATRMSFGARFADEPAAERGYNDIVKAIFQLWRYFSHCRRGVTGRGLAFDAIGLVLTLDNWMVMANDIFDQIFARAVAMARESDPLIEEQDHRPIAFSSIPDFEAALSIGTVETFMAALRRSAEPAHRGGHVQHHHENDVGKGSTRREYPFADLSAMLPWWGIIQEGQAVDAARLGGV